MECLRARMSQPALPRRKLGIPYPVRLQSMSHYEPARADEGCRFEWENALEQWLRSGLNMPNATRLSAESLPCIGRDHAAALIFTGCRYRQRCQLQVLFSLPSISRQWPSKLPAGILRPRVAARVGAMSTVSTGAGCSNPGTPLRQNSNGTRRS